MRIKQKPKTRSEAFYRPPTGRAQNNDRTRAAIMPYFFFFFKIKSSSEPSAARRDKTGGGVRRFMVYGPAHAVARCVTGNFRGSLPGNHPAPTRAPSPRRPWYIFIPAQVRLSRDSAPYTFLGNALRRNACNAILFKKSCRSAATAHNPCVITLLTLLLFRET